MAGDGFSEFVDEPGRRPDDSGEPAHPVLPFPVVGLGASAGGLEALEAFVKQAPADSGMAYVVVQHLSPDHRSLMAELLRRHTSMPVEYAVNGLTLQTDRVYLIPPQYHLTLSEGCFRLLDRNPGSHLHFPIDLFFHSLALEQREYAVGVVLSGTGTDGVRGVRTIKEAGGLVFVQEPDSARFDGMPRAAVQTGLADRVLPPASMPAELVAITKAVKGLPAGPAESAGAAVGSAYDEVLALLRRETGVDFRGYKSKMVNRRLLRRMAVNGAASLEEYLAFARRMPAELIALERELLVSVTHFFRDPAVFAQLRRLSLAPIVRGAAGRGGPAVLGGGLRDRRGGLLARDRGARGGAPGGPAPQPQDLRHRPRPPRPRRGEPRGLPGEHRGRRAGGAPRALLRAARERVRRLARAPASGALRPPQPDERPAVHAARPGQLPQPPHLPRAAPAAASPRPLPLRAARRGDDAPRLERVPGRPRGRLPRHRPPEPHLHLHGLAPARPARALVGRPFRLAPRPRRAARPPLGVRKAARRGERRAPARVRPGGPAAGRALRPAPRLRRSPPLGAPRAGPVQPERARDADRPRPFRALLGPAQNPAPGERGSLQERSRRARRHGGGPADPAVRRRRGSPAGGRHLRGGGSPAGSGRGRPGRRRDGTAARRAPAGAAAVEGQPAGPGRGAADLERGAAEHERGARLGQRGAAEHERGAAGGQRGAAFRQRGARAQDRPPHRAARRHGQPPALDAPGHPVPGRQPRDPQVHPRGDGVRERPRPRRGPADRAPRDPGGRPRVPLRPAARARHRGEGRAPGGAAHPVPRARPGAALRGRRRRRGRGRGDLRGRDRPAPGPGAHAAGAGRAPPAGGEARRLGPYRDRERGLGPLRGRERRGPAPGGGRRRLRGGLRRPGGEGRGGSPPWPRR